MLDLIKKLSETSKRTEKEEILSALPQDQADRFKRVASLCYGHLYDYYLSPTTVPEAINESAPSASLDDVLDYVEEMGVSGGFSSNDKKAVLVERLQQLHQDDIDVVRLILKGNLGCGVSSSTVNKVWPDTIFIPPYMRCDTLNGKNYFKQKGERYVQTKLDGEFQNIIFDTKNGECFFMSREFKDNTARFLSERHTEIAKTLYDGTNPGFVLHGEVLMVGDDGNILPREIGNGLLNRDDVDKSRLLFVVWDMVNIDDFYAGSSKVPYFQRFEKMARLIKSSVFDGSGIKLVKNTICNSLDEVTEVFNEARRQGEEGVICKSSGGLWKHGTSKDQLKAKVAVDCDMKIVGINMSEETKYKGMIGSIDIESSCGKISCSVGSGLKDSDRADLGRFYAYIEEEKIFKIRYNDVVSNELKPGKYALYLPRIIEARNDKSEADDYQKIVDQLTQFQLVL